MGNTNRVPRQQVKLGSESPKDKNNEWEEQPEHEPLINHVLIIEDDMKAWKSLTQKSLNNKHTDQEAKALIPEQGSSIEQDDKDDLNNVLQTKTETSEEGPSAEQGVDNMVITPQYSTRANSGTAVPSHKNPIAQPLSPIELDKDNCSETTTDNAVSSEKENIFPSCSSSNTCKNPDKQEINGSPFRRRGSLMKLDEYKCPLCPSAFKVKIGLKSHLRVMHTSPDELSKDAAAAQGLSVFKTVRICENCGRKSFTEEAFKFNVDSSNNGLPYRCQFCSLSYRSKQLRELHEGRAHSV